MEKAKQEYNNTMYMHIVFFSFSFSKEVVGIDYCTYCTSDGWLVPFYGARKCTFSCRSFVLYIGIEWRAAYILSYIEYTHIAPLYDDDSFFLNFLSVPRTFSLEHEASFNNGQL